MEFGEKLKYLRESKGYGVNQLALKSGVSASQISRFESGERKDPSLGTLTKISNALGVSISYFGSKVNDKSMTVAAHIDENMTDEEMDEIINYIDFVKQKHKKD